jgi:hypothetical protein
MQTDTHLKHFFGITLAATIAAALTACGGGGSSAGTDNNPFKALQGTYAVACDGFADTTGLNTSWSSQGSVAVTDLVGSDKANVTLHSLSYSSPAGDSSGGSCDAARLTTDLTVTGQIRALGTTKAYTDAGGATVAAQVVEFTYYGFTITKGSLSGTLPLPNTTTQIGYVLDGNKLYLGHGHRGTDGLGDALSRRYGLRQ